MAAILNQPQFQDADKAREYLERQVWPNGRVCPHCGAVGEHYVLSGKSNRPGLYKCADCREPFTVTVGTVFERSKVGLHLWLQAVHLMSASKKGISAKQLERMLGVTYKTAWFMCHRIREAMKTEPSNMLGGPGSSGIVEADETYWGVAADEEGIRYPKGSKRGATNKMKIVTLVERHGDKRSFHVANVNSATLGPILKAQIAKTARLMTDEAKYYIKDGKHFANHETVNHKREEYARGDVTTKHRRIFFRHPQARAGWHLPQRQRAAPATLLRGVRFPLEHSHVSRLQRHGPRKHRAQGYRWQAPNVSADSRVSLRVSVIHRQRREP